MILIALAIIVAGMSITILDLVRGRRRRRAVFINDGDLVDYSHGGDACHSGDGGCAGE